MSNGMIWSGGAVLYLKAKHEAEKKIPEPVYSNTRLFGNQLDSKHATSKNQQMRKGGVAII
jgi:hypothetical protein